MASGTSGAPPPGCWSISPKSSRLEIAFPMLTDRSWLDAKATRTLIAALDAGGVDFRFVGGAVRDGLLGRKVADVDVATPARPEAVIRAVEAAGLKAIPTGIA